MRIKFLVVCLLVLSSVVFARSEKDAVLNMLAIANYINNSPDKQDMLVVFDIDDTLLTADKGLGSDAWYRWQTEKYANLKPTKEQKIRCLYEDTIGLLYELGTLKPTETKVPGIVSQIQQQSISTIALTARSDAFREATERELRRNGFNLARTAISNTPITLVDDNNTYVTFNNGIMMTSGLNKGKMLKRLLSELKRSFKVIVFVDDTEENIDNVYNAYKDDENVSLLAFHYGNVERRVGVFTKDDAERLHKEWVALNETLNTIFPDRKRIYSEVGCMGYNGNGSKGKNLTFVHAPADDANVGDWSKSHNDTIINYVDWENKTNTARLVYDNNEGKYKFLVAPFGVFEKAKNSNSIQYITLNGSLRSAEIVQENSKSLIFKHTWKDSTKKPYYDSTIRYKTWGVGNTNWVAKIAIH